MMHIDFISQFVENGHKTGKVARHTGCVGNTWYVSVTEEEMEKTLGKK